MIFVSGLITSMVFVISSCTIITVSPEGGYKGIVVAINKNVDENIDVVENLKELLINASAALHVATRGAMYFEEITISIPSTWSDHPNYDQTVKENFRDSDIRIDISGFEPFTLQSGGCGEPGKYIELNANYLNSLKANKEQLNEVEFPDKRFVQEWAKFRYGVFDEMVRSESNNLKRYYTENGEEQPTVCSTEIAQAGYNVDPKGNPCDPALTPGKCYFEVPPDYVTATSSIMHSSSIPTVNTFCDDTPERQHNRKAPNEHNLICKYRSTWDVITSHDDFKIRKVPASIPVRETKPNFRLVRTIGGGGKVVLILDISGSMQGVPMELLYQTAKNHILDNAPDGSELGIVAFGSEATILHRVQKIDNNTRQVMASRVPILANGGGTAIGKGLLAGVNALKESGQLEGSILLLITDGEENVPPNIDVVLPDLIEDRIVVSVIAYGDKASDKLEGMAKDTGGRASIFRDIYNKEAQTSVLENQIIAATTVQADVEFEAVTLKDEKIFMTNSEMKDSITLEPELGKNTIFKFSWTSAAPVEVELSSPSDRSYNWQSVEYQKKQNGKTVKFRFPQAETGTWTYKIIRQNDVNTDVDFSLSSEPNDPKKQPVRVNSWLDKSEVELTIRPKIFARVYKDAYAVLNVTVKAIVTGPNNFSATFPMRDDGRGADAKANNGLYSGYITKFKGDGRYFVRARVFGGKNAKVKRNNGKIEKKIKVKRMAIDDDSDQTGNEENHQFDNYDYEYDTEEGQDVGLNSFERVQDVGTFRVINWKEDLRDLIPPSRVLDLNVLNPVWTIDDNVSVTLDWTAPGDDYDTGNATSIDLRISDNFDKLIFDFDKQYRYDESSVVYGSLEPFVSGTLTTVTLIVPLELFFANNDTNNSTSQVEPRRMSLYFAVRYSDESNNIADISNIIIAHFVKEIPLPIEIEIQKTQTFKNDEDRPTAAVLAIAAIISIVVVVALISAIVYFVRFKHKYQSVVMI